MSAAWRTTVVAVTLGLGLATVVGGCATVGRPDVAGWEEQATRALEDVAGEVALVRLTLDSAARERTWSSYTVVVLAQAEEAVTATEDDLDRAQVPSSLEDRAAGVTRLLHEASRAVRDARGAAVVGKHADRATLVSLADLVVALRRAAGAGAG